MELNSPRCAPMINHRRATSKSCLWVTAAREKGSHHLLTAWNLARLPAEAGLTLVCRDLDPRMIALIQHGDPNVTLLKGVSSDELAQLYARSHLLAVPSLVEGFGFVYLEALSFGCPVLGTTNTCLPDLGDETSGVFTVAPGNAMELAQFLKRLSGHLDELLAVRESARKCAERFTWPAFRRQLSSLVQGLVEARRNSRLPQEAVARHAVQHNLPPSV